MIDATHPAFRRASFDAAELLAGAAPLRLRAYRNAIGSLAAIGYDMPILQRISGFRLPEAPLAVSVEVLSHALLAAALIGDRRATPAVTGRSEGEIEATKATAVLAGFAVPAAYDEEYNLVETAVEILGTDGRELTIHEKRILVLRLALLGRNRGEIVAGLNSYGRFVDQTLRTVGLNVSWGSSYRQKGRSVILPGQDALVARCRAAVETVRTRKATAVDAWGALVADIRRGRSVVGAEAA